MKLANIGVTFLLGLAGGTLFFLLHLPLPWILGSAFAVMTMNALRPQRIEWPKTLGEAGIIVVAFKLGQTVTVDTLRTIWNDLPGMILSSIMWICICLAIGLLFSKAAAFLVGLTAAAAWMLTTLTSASIVTWFLALAPGGLGEVAVTALVLGADVQQVTAYQIFRLVIVLVAAPPFLRLVLRKKKHA